MALSQPTPRPIAGYLAALRELYQRAHQVASGTGRGLSAPRSPSGCAWRSLQPTDPVDAVTRLGRATAVSQYCKQALSWSSAPAWSKQVTSTVTAMRPDDRTQPIVVAHDEEERLSRMLIAAWYALRYRVPIAFFDRRLAILSPLFAAQATDRPRSHSYKPRHMPLIVCWRQRQRPVEPAPLATVAA